MFIAPSLLAAHPGRLEAEAEAAIQAGADWLHVDIMDGHFVPAISMGPRLIKALHDAEPAVPLDVHLMVSSPAQFIADCVNWGAASLTVHYETCHHLHGVLQQIRSLGCKAGVALNPHTPTNVLQCLLGDLDTVLLMAVNPGLGGQRFIPFTLEKIRQLSNLRDGSSGYFLISVDGGVGISNAALIREAGADVLIAGSAVFGSDDYSQAIEQLRGKQTVTK